jgi:hypothetical protein
LDYPLDYPVTFSRNTVPQIETSLGNYTRFRRR